MKKLTSKKGFTLIEMLVVIAIIAVLVAIIVPTVTSATTKAKAATDAANLRSAKAIVTIGVLDGTITQDNAVEKCKAQGIPETGKLNGGALTITITEGSDAGATVTVAYGDDTIDSLAASAGS